MGRVVPARGRLSAPPDRTLGPSRAPTAAHPRAAQQLYRCQAVGWHPPRQQPSPPGGCPAACPPWAPRPSDHPPGTGTPGARGQDPRRAPAPPPPGRARPAPPPAPPGSRSPAMAALLRRALRAAALLAGAPRRTAAAWIGKREPPDRALEEAERCGAAGPGVRDRGRAAHLSPPQGTAAGGSAAAAAAAGAGRGARSPRAHPDLAGDGADAVSGGAGPGGVGSRCPRPADRARARRFLRQEQPEEWPPERLAQGFGVSPDVVRRVLRSRACPPPRRRLRQDERALSAAPATGHEVRAPDGTLLYRLPRGGRGPGAQ